MKNIILLIFLISFCGCKPNTQENLAPSLEEIIKEPRAMLLYDFRQTTKYPEFTDDDYDTGHFSYWFYEDEDFLNVSISGVTDEKIINDALEEFKSVMKKRNVEMPIKVYIYEKTIRTSETTSTSKGLLREFEIKEF